MFVFGEKLRKPQIVAISLAAVGVAILATSVAYMIRPVGVFGVVLGSEIMKNANISNAPF